LELDYATSSGEIPRGISGKLLMRKLIVFAAAASALWISGCNTVAGVGKDVAAAGKAVTSTANDVRK
jgi:predicted small secreted protein